MREFQLQGGGWDIVDPTRDRMAFTQRIADGHLKSSGYLHRATFTTKKFDVQVEDRFYMVTTPTLGLVEYVGIVVKSAAEGFKAKVVSFQENDLALYKAKKSTFDPATEEFTAEDSDVAALDDIGDSVYYVTAAPEVPLDGFQENTDLIGFEILELPEDGLPNDVVIELTIAYSQPARTPADPSCCEGFRIVSTSPASVEREEEEEEVTSGDDAGGDDAGGDEDTTV